MTDPTYRPSRRIVFQGLGALGTAVALAGCGSGDDGGDDEAAVPDAGSELATTADVPVGGGLILSEEKIVITQPTEGEFKAFTAVCTHQNCTVAEVQETINCTCHNSKYSIEDGSVQGGPAPAPLEEIAISVDGDTILAA
ncbi:MAG TPA: Rieske (2Fe-2S) protein [Nocardioides sp.]|nr:Rieske (2Fe-2S) protein [Nocardioides sp.]